MDDGTLRVTRYKTEISVISLSSAGERRAGFAEQARSARAAWRFVDAVTELPSNLSYSARGAARRFGRALTPGEISCFASHWARWVALLDSSERQCIVLEDDVIVDWNALDVIAQVDFAAFQVDLLRLYATHPFKYRVAVNRFLSPHTHLLEARGMFLGCQGYVLTRRGAARLVELAAEVTMPVDWFMSRYWTLGFPNYCVFPFPLVERLVPSHIGERSEAPPVSYADWSARQGFRVVDRVQRAAADWLRRTTFRPSPDSGPSYVERLSGAGA